MNTTLDHVSNPNITTSPVATKPSPLLLDRVSGGASGATKGTLGQGEGSILPLPPKTPDLLMLQTKHASFLTLLNTLCNTVQPIIDLEKHRLSSGQSKADLKHPTIPTNPK